MGPIHSDDQFHSKAVLTTVSLVSFFAVLYSSMGRALTLPAMFGLGVQPTTWATHSKIHSWHVGEKLPPNGYNLFFFFNFPFQDVC